MIIGILQIEIFIPHSLSLKSKRRVLKSIKDRVHTKFNVSISETDYMNKWQRALLGIACVSNEKRHCDKVLNEVERLIDMYYEVQVVERVREFI